MKVSQKAKAYKTTKQTLSGLGLIGLLFLVLSLFLNFLQS